MTLKGGLVWRLAGFRRDATHSHHLNCLLLVYRLMIVLM